MKIFKIPVKKILFLILLLVAGIFFNVKRVQAYYIGGTGGGGGGGGNGGYGGPSSTFDYKRDYWEPSVYGTSELNQPSWINTSLSDIAASVVDLTMGPANEAYITDSNRGGVVADVAGLIGTMYSTPPASSVEYFADIGEHAGIVKPAMAQGVGFQGLRPFLNIWKQFRNITYLFFTIIFIIIGFAIMFRVKLNPQTTANLQNTLPKIVLAIILVSFSYAIAGLLIDLIYVLTSIVFSLFRTNLANTTDIGNINALLSENIFSFAIRIMKGGDVTQTIGKSLQEIVGSLFTDSLSELSFFGKGIAIIGQVVIAIAIAFATFKLFFSLLMSYISIIFAVIFSPIILSLEAIPGQSGFSMWIKMVLSNIIVFPVTIAIFVIGVVLVNTPTAGNSGWVAPFLGQGWGENVAPLIGLGIILVAPGIVEKVKAALAAPSLGEMGAQVMQPVGGAWRTITAPTKAIGWAKEGVSKELQSRIGTKIIPKRQ